MSWNSFGLTALKFANLIVRMQVPAVAAAEDAIVGLKRGGDRAKYVDDLIAAGVQLQDLIDPSRIQNDAEFLEGARMMRDGLVKIHNAAARVAPQGA